MKKKRDGPAPVAEMAGPTGDGLAGLAVDCTMLI